MSQHLATPPFLSIVVAGESRTPQPAPRLHYAIEVLFETLIGVKIDVHYAHDTTEIDNTSVLYIIPDTQLHTFVGYLPSFESYPAPTSIPFLALSGDTLFRSDMQPLAPVCEQFGNMPALFPIPTLPRSAKLIRAHIEGAQLFSLLPFDLLTMLFFLVTRYEEYLPFTQNNPTTTDEHGRFRAAASVAHREGFLHLPLLNIWANHLRTELARLYPALHFEPRAYRFVPTYDIDMAWSYRHKTWQQLIGHSLRSAVAGDWRSFHDRFAVWAGKQPDPFDTFDYLDALHNKHAAHIPNALYFWLLGDYGKHDKNSPPEGEAMQTLIRKVAANPLYTMGIHPSYKAATVDHDRQLQTEIVRLERATSTLTDHSRQHYLLLHFPETYQRLLGLAMFPLHNDYTMGYADAIGFRASIATPYRWFDLAENETTELIVHPFAFMDVTLQQYLRYDANEAITAATQLIEEVRRHGGTLYTLWHNSSLSERAPFVGWRRVYEAILDAAAR